jgi:N-acetylmuramoyl-L-alanine amidase
MMKHTKPIDRIILHCTATPAGREVRHDDLRRWHVDERGWSHIGYHTLVTLAGECIPCRPEQYQGAHTRGQNNGSIGIAYAGGLSPRTNKAVDTRTDAQRAGIERAFDAATLQYGALHADGSKRLLIFGHRDFANKACPSFDTHAEYGDVWAVYP